MIKGVIKNRKIVFFMLVCLLLAGVYSYVILPKQEAPDIFAPIISVSIAYPGASIEDVENFVTKKIEAEAANLEDVDYVISRSYYSYSTFYVVFNYGLSRDEAEDRLQDMMKKVENKLPDGVMPYEIRADLAKTAGIIIALSSDDYDYEMLDFYGEKVKDRLSKIEGISSFETVGSIDKEVSVKIDHEKMNRLGISYDELIKLIKIQNLEIPSGEIDSASGKVPLYIKGSFKSLEDIENIVVSGSKTTGTVLTLRDIARVEFKEASNQSIYSRNGKKSILLVGYFESDKNILLIGDDVRDEMENIKQELPEELDFAEVLYQPEEVSSSIKDFVLNLLIGVALVILVVFLGMGIRNAIIVSLAIPTSILFTVISMPALGIKVHSITITAFIVALGMLVDNAIVVSDNIQLKLDEGMDRMDACVKGTKEVVVAILTSTLTTIGAFTPLILLNSLAGDYLQALPKVVMLSLTASFLFSFLVTPSLAYVFFKPHEHERIPENTFMVRLLSLCMKKKVLSVGVFVAVVVVLASLIVFVNVTFFPKADKKVMYIDVVADKNISTEYTKKVTDRLEEFLASESGVVNYTTAVGGALPKFYTTVGIYPPIPENAQTLIEIDISKTEFTKNTDYAIYLQNSINELMLPADVKVLELEIAEPFVSPILVRILGDKDRVYEAAKTLEASLEGVEGARNVRSNLSPKTYNYSVDLDSDKISYLGLSKYDILNEVSIALMGRDASVFKENGREYNIKVDSTAKSLEELENMSVKSSITGRKYLLKDMGTLSFVPYDKVIKKYNGKYEIQLMADLEKGYDSATVEAGFKEALKGVNTSGVELIYDGENQKIAYYFGDLAVSGLLAIFIIFTILLLQFRNFKNALIIFITLPLSTAGAIFGLFIFNEPLSFTAAVGLVSLVGIVVNNAIVLMEFMEAKRAEGLYIEEVAKTASLVRFRPIMLSTVTTCIGLLPLVFSSSELFKPMSVGLASGLLISTFLTLVFVPLVYSLVYREEASK